MEGMFILGNVKINFLHAINYIFSGTMMKQESAFSAAAARHSLKRNEKRFPLTIVKYSGIIIKINYILPPGKMKALHFVSVGLEDTKYQRFFFLKER